MKEWVMSQAGCSGLPLGLISKNTAGVFLCSLGDMLHFLLLTAEQNAWSDLVFPIFIPDRMLISRRERRFLVKIPTILLLKDAGEKSSKAKRSTCLYCLAYQ